jgi:ribosomal protein L24
VKVIQGPQEGQEGKVTAILRKENRVIIEDVNMVLQLSLPSLS